MTMEMEQTIRLPDKEDLVQFLANEFAYPDSYVSDAMEKFYGHERFNEEKRCFHCEAKMAVYDFHVDALDSLVMKKLGLHVKSRLEKGEPFTEANKIHISGLGLTSNECDRKTQLRYLGLLAKYKEDDRHKGAMWVITKRGFAFLRGERVPKTVRVWRKQIIGRGDQQIDILEAQNQRPEQTDDGWDLKCFDAYTL